MAYDKDGLEERIAFLEAVEAMRYPANQILAGLRSIQDRQLTDETSETIQDTNSDGTPKFVEKTVPVLDDQGQPVMENGVAKTKTVQESVMTTRIIPATYGKPHEHGQELPDTERDRRYDHYTDMIRTLLTNIPNITLPAATPPPAGNTPPPPRKAPGGA